MKQGVKYFILTVLLVGVLVGAYFAYQALRGDGSAEITQAQSESVSEQSSGKAADFKAVDANGNDVTLSSYFGKPTVVNFWATWCGYCVREMPMFESKYKEMGDKINFVMVNLTDGDRETLKKATEHIKENKYTFPVLFDTYGEALQTYETYTIPVTLFINSDGTVMEKYTGALTDEVFTQKLSELS